MAIIKYLIGLVNSKEVVDDIDHLSNRRVLPSVSSSTISSVSVWLVWPVPSVSV